MSSTLAFVFPGQGSQQPGMLSDLAARYPLVCQTFAEASDALGCDLWRLVREDEAALNRTENTQPALLTAGIALWRLWLQEGGARPAWLAGHSLGEYTALTAAGMLSLADAVRLVALRGRLMQEAVPQGTGAMAAILGLSDDDVRAACADAAASGIVEAVNYNAPLQVVIAGETAAVQAAVQAASARGAKRAVNLPVSVPSHCSLMRPAAEKLAQALVDVAFHQSDILVVQNVAARVEGDADAVRQALVAQLYSPVQWVRSVEWMAAQGATRMIECGPGKVLCGLNKRISKGLACESLENETAFLAALAG